MLILLYGCTTWTLTKRIEKKLNGNYTRILRAILNKSWRQHPKKQQLYGHQPSITKTIKVRRTRHAGHCWRSRDKLISDVLLWTASHDRAKTWRPARTYIQQLEPTYSSSLRIRDIALRTWQKWRKDREEWWERVRDISAGGKTRWWWLYHIFFRTHTHSHAHTHTHIYIYIYTYYRHIGIIYRVFANDPKDQGPIPGRIIPKILEIALDASLLKFIIKRFGSMVIRAIQEKE